MAYNLLAITAAQPDWVALSVHYHQSERSFEIFPVSNGEDGLGFGICIPFNHFTQSNWQSTVTFLRGLSTFGHFTTYDMYTGLAIDINSYIPDGLAPD